MCSYILSLLMRLSAIGMMHHPSTNHNNPPYAHLLQPPPVGMLDSYMSAAKVHFIYDGIYNRRPLAYLPIRPTLCVVAILAKRWAVARTARHE